MGEAKLFEVHDKLKVAHLIESRYHTHKARKKLQEKANKKTDGVSAFVFLTNDLHRAANCKRGGFKLIGCETMQDGSWRQRDGDGGDRIENRSGVRRVGNRNRAKRTVACLRIAAVSSGKREIKRVFENDRWKRGPE